MSLLTRRVTSVAAVLLVCAVLAVIALIGSFIALAFQAISLFVLLFVLDVVLWNISYFAHKRRKASSQVQQPS